MDGFCEHCGRRTSVTERVLRGGIALCADCGLYLCPDCRHPVTQPVEPTRAGGRRFERAVPGFGVLFAVALAGSLALLSTQLPALLGPAPSGAVLDAVRTPGSSSVGAGAAVSTRPEERTASPVTRSPSQRAASPTPSGGERSEPSGPADVEAGSPVIRAWTGPYGETRVQVVLAVVNPGPGWIRLPRSRSTYRINDGGGREVASGAFTAALPEVIGPGKTAYLVDTLSVAFGAPSEFDSAEATVDAIRSTRPDVALAVDRIELSKGPGGGLRATGVVRNEGTDEASAVVVGIVAIGQDGEPMGAVFDLTDVGDIEPGESVPFDTEYPGAPPVEGTAGEVVGFAFVSS